MNRKPQLSDEIEQNEREYGDIIHLPHPVSRRHAPMNGAMRAAQFAPFAALTGYGEAIDRTTPVESDSIEDWELALRNIIEYDVSQEP